MAKSRAMWRGVSKISSEFFVAQKCRYSINGILRTLRASKQSEIDEIMDENKFLVGRHRTNHHAIHELIQERLSSANVANVIEELQQMLTEEKTAGELKARKLLDERARLEESITDLRLQATISAQKQADELRVAKESQAEMENMRIRLDQGKHGV